MIYDLADDIRQAMAVFPRGHRAYGKLAVLCEALFGSIPGLAEQPQLLTQTLTNRLRRRPVSAEARVLIERGEHLLRDREWWLRAEDGILETRNWQDIVAVSPRRNLVHCVRKEGGILDCRMDSQDLVRTHHLPTQHLVALAVCPSDERLAVLTTEGAVWTVDGLEPVSLRPRESCFAGLAKGFIGVDAGARLTYWCRDAGTLVHLASEMPTQGCGISVTRNGEAAVVLAGDRPQSQRVLLIRGRDGAVPTCVTWPGDGRLVTASCLDDSARLLVLSTTDRQLTLVDLETGAVVHRIALSQSPGRPLGEVVHCSCIDTDGGPKVVFADLDGVICLWETAPGRLVRLRRYREIHAQSRLVCLEWLQDGEHILVATPDSLGVLGVEESFDSESAATAHAVTSCAIGRDGWLTLVQQRAQRVTWVFEGAVRATNYHPAFRPSVVAATGEGGEVMVGGHGTLVVMRPGRKVDSNDALDIFDRPIVSILPQESGTVAAVCETGEVKLVRLSEEWVRPLHPWTRSWQQQGACRVGDGMDILCWGRFIEGAATSRVYLLCRDGRVEQVFSGRDQILSVVSTPKDPLIHVALQEEVVTYARQGRSWGIVTRRFVRIRAMAALGDDRLAIVSATGPWLEIWAATQSLPTLANCYLPVSVTCIETSGQAVLLGTHDGQHVLLTLHHEKERVQ